MKFKNVQFIVINETREEKSFYFEFQSWANFTNAKTNINLSSIPFALTEIFLILVSSAID